MFLHNRFMGGAEWAGETDELGTWDNLFLLMLPIPSPSKHTMNGSPGVFFSSLQHAAMLPMI